LFSLSPILQAFIAGCFTWAVTALGSAVAFAFTTLNRRLIAGPDWHRGNNPGSPAAQLLPDADRLSLSG